MSRDEMSAGRWWVVVGSVLGLAFSIGPVLYFTFGLFVYPLTEEMGWSRGTTSMALTMGGVLAAAASPFAGAAMDRWGMRKVALISITLFSVLVASIGLAPTSTWFIVLYGLAGLAGAGQAPIAYARAITSLFDRRRGLALGLAMAGVGLGVAVVPQVARLIIDNWGWRGGYFGLGALTFVVAFPAVAFLVREVRSDAGVLNTFGCDVREAVRDRRFWLIAFAILLVGAATNGTIVHAVPMLRDRGIAEETAAVALGVSGIALIAGRLLAGYMLDKVFAPYIAIASFLVPVLGIFFLSIDAGVGMNLAGVFLVGLGLGAEIDLIAYLVSRYFGLKYFGQLYGWLFLSFAVGSGLGPLAMGRIHDQNGSYGVALISFCVVLIISAVAMLFLGPYTYSTKKPAPPVSPVSKIFVDEIVPERRNPAVDITKFTQQSKFTRYQFLIVFAVMFIMAVDGFDFNVVVFLAPLITKDFPATGALTGIMLSASTLGVAIGSIALSPLADQIGRRSTVIICLVVALAGMIIAAVAPGMGVFIAGRVVTGLGIGGLITTLGTLLKEYTPQRRLGLVMGLFASSYGLGGYLSAVIAGPLALSYGWRSAIMLGVVLSVLALLVAIFLLAESLEYLASKPGPASLTRINRILRRMGHEPLIESPMPPASKETGRLREVFGPSVLSFTLIATLGFACLQTSFYMLATWTPQAISVLGGSPELSIRAAAVIGFSILAGSLLFAALSTWVPVRSLGVIAAIACSAAFVGISTSTAAPENIVLFAALAALSGNACIATFYTLTPRLYPAHARSSGFGMVLGVGRLAAITPPIIAGILLDAGSTVSSIFLLFGVTVALAGVCIIGLGLLSARSVKYAGGA